MYYFEIVFPYFVWKLVVANKQAFIGSEQIEWNFVM